MNITVYLGAKFGNDDNLKVKVRELGEYIGTSNHTLIYGGSKEGLMGILATSVIESGGKAIGIEPRKFVEREWQYNGLTQLIVTEDMPSRKTKMIECGDLFIAFPGGTGTLEEISEVISLNSLDEIDKPCILYNLNGYYEDLKHQLEKMVDMGLCTKKRLKNVYVLSTLEEIKEIINKNEK